MSDTIGSKIADILLGVGALKISVENPFRYASGLLSPIYCDNRMILSHPQDREVVTKEFERKVSRYQVEAIAGTATAGIPHAAWLAHELKLPMFYVRGENKGHGKQQKIEGGSVEGKKVVLIEDLVTTGGSSIAALKSLRTAGADLCCCLSIFSYAFPEPLLEFKRLDVPFEALGTFEDLITLLAESGDLTPFELDELRKWHSNPSQWKSSTG